VSSKGSTFTLDLETLTWCIRNDKKLAKEWFSAAPLLEVLIVKLVMAVSDLGVREYLDITHSWAQSGRDDVRQANEKEILEA